MTTLNSVDLKAIAFVIETVNQLSEHSNAVSKIIDTKYLAYVKSTCEDMLKSGEIV